MDCLCLMCRGWLSIKLSFKMDQKFHENKFLKKGKEVICLNSNSFYHGVNGSLHYDYKHSARATDVFLHQKYVHKTNYDPPSASQQIGFDVIGIPTRPLAEPVHSEHILIE